MTEGQETDEFWQLALKGNDDKKTNSDGDDDNDDELTEERSQDRNDGLNEDEDQSIPPITYEIKLQPEDQIDQFEAVTFQLTSMPLTDGIFSPLGAQLWYGQALLAAMLLRPSYPPLKEALTSILLTTNNTDRENVQASTALELGSGACGLAGLVLSWLLANNNSSTGKTKRPSHIILTDNEQPVLKQLRRNITINLNRLQNSYPKKDFPTVTVAPLEWNDGVTTIQAFIDAPSNNPSENLKLIFGSELVYTESTATACANIVTSMLERYPKALVLIVQVSDRSGWNDVFLPTVTENQNLQVLSQDVVADADLHELASSLLRHGGTLDRFDFGVVYITSAQRSSSHSKPAFI